MFGIDDALFAGVIGGVGESLLSGGVLEGALGAIGGGAGGLFSGIGGLTGNGLLSAASGLGSGFLSSAGQADANTGNIWMTQAQRDWQTMMSNTAYQRAVKDLKAAGLNPMLAYTQGGATTPSGGIGAPMGNVAGAGADAAAKTTASAAALQQADAQTQLLREQAVKTQAETQNVQADTLVKVAQEPYTRALTGQSYATAAQIEEAMQKIAAEKDYIREQLKENKPHWEVRELIQRVAQLNAQENLLRAEWVHADKYFGGRAREKSALGSLRMLDLPLAENLARAQHSTWMRDFSPYMPDIQRAATSASSLGLRLPIPHFTFRR